MTDARVLQGLSHTRFSPPLPRTPIGAIIALRGRACGQGFGAVYPESDTANVANGCNGATDRALRPLHLPLQLFSFKIKGLRKLQRCNASRAHTYTRARHSCACACAITCATVAALQRCTLSFLFLYLPEKKEEKQGFTKVLSATPVRSAVAGAVAAWVKPLKSLDLRGF
jgi:hypothetical protein